MPEIKQSELSKYSNFSNRFRESVGGKDSASQRLKSLNLMQSEIGMRYLEGAKKANINLDSYHSARRKSPGKKSNNRNSKAR